MLSPKKIDDPPKIAWAAEAPQGQLPGGAAVRIAEVVELIHDHLGQAEPGRADGLDETSDFRKGDEVQVKWWLITISFG